MTECYVDTGEGGELPPLLLESLSRRYQHWRGMEVRTAGAMSAAFRSRLRARLLLEWGFSRSGSELATATVRYGSHGKPAISTCGLHFNFAHDGAAVAVAVGAHESGVDVTAAVRFRPSVNEVLALLWGTSVAEIALLSCGELRQRWAVAEAMIKAHGLSLPQTVFAVRTAGEVAPLARLSRGLSLGTCSTPELSVAVATMSRVPARIRWLERGQLEAFAVRLARTG